MRAEGLDGIDPGSLIIPGDEMRELVEAEARGEACGTWQSDRHHTRQDEA